MKTSYWARVCEKKTGNIRHISGRWESAETMRKELLKDGYIVIVYGENKED